MLFLFVLMLVGVDTRRLARGDHRGPAAGRPILAGSGFGVLLVVRHRQRAHRRRRGPRRAPTRARRQRRRASPQLIFTRYVFAFEVDPRAADHRGRRRDGAGPPRARPSPKRPSASWPAADADVRRAGAHPGPLPEPRRLRPAQRGRHPGPAARRHRLARCRSPQTLTEPRRASWTSPRPLTAGLDRRTRSRRRRSAVDGRGGATSEPRQLPRTCRRSCSRSARSAC